MNENTGLKVFQDVISEIRAELRLGDGYSVIEAVRAVRMRAESAEQELLALTRLEAMHRREEAASHAKALALRVDQITVTPQLLDMISDLCDQTDALPMQNIGLHGLCPHIVRAWIIKRRDVLRAHAAGSGAEAVSNG